MGKVKEMALEQQEAKDKEEARKRAIVLFAAEPDAFYERARVWLSEGNEKEDLIEWLLCIGGEGTKIDYMFGLDLALGCCIESFVVDIEQNRSIDIAMEEESAETERKGQPNNRRENGYMPEEN